MKIVQFRGEYPNFGDELNEWLWPQLLPDFFDENARTLFIGIGSTIGDAHDLAAKKIVFGAGFVPSYHPMPDVHDGNWKIYFVRGARTAARLKLAPELAISDAGILLRKRVDLSRRTNEVVSFMPHWESMMRGNWERVCALAGIQLIDPRSPVETVITQLLRSKLVIAEAMHGAIIADAFRIPFVPVLPLNHVHRDKWFDWAESLNIELHPQRLWPSTLTECGRGTLQDAVTSYRSRLKRRVQTSALAPWLDARLAELAAYRLTRLAQCEPSLSSEQALMGALARMEEKLVELQRDYASVPRALAV